MGCSGLYLFLTTAWIAGPEEQYKIWTTSVSDVNAAQAIIHQYTFIVCKIISPPGIKPFPLPNSLKLTLTFSTVILGAKYLVEEVLAQGL